jgi:hypothetical protein
MSAAVLVRPRLKLAALDPTMVSYPLDPTLTVPRVRYRLLLLKEAALADILPTLSEDANRIELAIRLYDKGTARLRQLPDNASAQHIADAVETFIARHRLCGPATEVLRIGLLTPAGPEGAVALIVAKKTDAGPYGEDFCDC